MAPAHDCSWRKLAEERGRTLDDAQIQLATLRDQVSTLQGQLAAAKAKLEDVERKRFARSTERLPPVERELAAQAKTEVEEATESAPVEAPKGAEPKTNRGRKRQEREEAPSVREVTVEHPVSDHVRKCPSCGAMAQPVGTGKFSTEWDYIPGQFVRRRHIQEVVACSCGKHIARCEPPLRVFDRTQYGPGLMAYLIVSKCADSTPIYRIEKQFQRAGIPIARSTLNDLLHRAASVLEAIYDALVRRVVTDPHCQADETSFRLHNRPEKRGFVWTFLAGKQVIYTFSGDRSGQTPSRLLVGTTGTLVVDGYTGYNEVTAVQGRTRAGCWSHARRYLFKALDQAPEARDALDMILILFRVERDAIRQEVFGTPTHLAMRKARSEPVIERLKAWVAEQKPKHLPEGPMGAALRYITNQWAPLTVFLGHPKVPIHNNASESALRIVALLRKNALFFGNEGAARNFSILLSLVTTAERHGLNPLAYIEDVLMRVQTHPAKDVADLLPDRWKPPR